MKILKNNFNEDTKSKLEPYVKPYPRIHICEKCGSELQYEKEDLEDGVYGAMHITCPLCGYKNMLDGNENDIVLTKDNVKFPTHFHHTSVENGAVDNCNNEFVKKCISESINYFRENKDAHYYYHGTGSTMVCVFRFDGDEEYEVVVTDNYYETFIRFEEEDY